MSGPLQELMVTKIKICGITCVDDARYAAICGADLLGFIFFKKSPRYVTPAQARTIIDDLPSSVTKVGVFVNEDPHRVKAIASSCPLDILQFHGDETADDLESFRGFKVMKALRLRDRASFEGLERYGDVWFLFDAFREGRYGGTGQVFDWRLLEELKKIKNPFFISGGLTPANVGELLKKIDCFGVDVSSGIEKAAGKKDPRLVRAFIETVKDGAGR